jgi:tetratricopeptide (TPR) repeat protein
VRPREFTGLADATDWYDELRGTLLAAVDRAAEHRYDTHVWQLTCLLRDFQQLRHHTDDELRTSELAVRHVERCDDAARVRTWNGRGAALQHAGRYEEAIDWQRRSLALCERVGNHHGASVALTGLGLSLRSTGRLDEAIAALTAAVAEARPTGNPARLGHSLLSLGAVESAAGRLADSERHNRQALALYRELGARYHQALALSNIAEALLDMDAVQEAVSSADEALTLLAGLDDWISGANALMTKGHALARLGRPDAARQAYHRALAIVHHSGDPQQEARVRQLLALLDEKLPAGELAAGLA